MIPMRNRSLIEDFGKRIRQLRTERNLSQEQLAEKTGFHRTYIGMIEPLSIAIDISDVVIVDPKAVFRVFGFAS